MRMCRTTKIRYSHRTKDLEEDQREGETLLNRTIDSE